MNLNYTPYFPDLFYLSNPHCRIKSFVKALREASSINAWRQLIQESTLSLLYILRIRPSLRTKFNLPQCKAKGISAVSNLLQTFRKKDLETSASTPSISRTQVCSNLVKPNVALVPFTKRHASAPGKGDSSFACKIISRTLSSQWELRVRLKRKPFWKT